MTLTSGMRLGSFELVGPIGAGGMGEVYRARDTRLQRDVAIKVLPSAVTADPDRRARFEREAQSVAALNHPNILAVYETGESDGVPYMVTELLEGETLRTRLQHGPLPVRKAIDIAMQIARGLGAAHDKGLVHRDLKPDNIFLLADGQAKILDFGLARPTPTGSGATATAALTDAGTTMGTVGYMSPEQVRGQAVDGRTDLFALGAVLFEILTGRRAFQRDTTADTISAILNQDPPELTTLRAELPPALDRVVRHCLEKNPAERFQSARDVAFALSDFSGTHASAAAAILPDRTAGRRWRRRAVVAALALAALAAGMLVGRTTRRLPAPVTFEQVTWDAQWITNARFGADGRTIVFSAAATGSVPHLFVIRPGAVVSEPLGDRGMHLLSVSSKGELAVLTDARLAFHRLFRGTLARMTMDGGARPLVANVGEADWSPDGSTLAITRLEKGTVLLEYPIGHVLYRKSTGYVSDPRVSPDGAQVAFFDHEFLGDDRGVVKVVNRAGTERTLTGEYWGLQGLAWSQDGQAVLFSGTGQGADSYQPAMVNVAGTPAVRQPFASAGGLVVQDVADDGRLLAVRRDADISIRARLPGESAEREFAWLDFPAGGWLSRDGKSLLFTDQNRSAGPNYAVSLRSIDGGRVVRLGEGVAVSLSPDGRWATALVPSTGDIVLYPTGIGDPVKLARGPIAHYVGAVSRAQWFPDSRRLLVCGSEADRPPRCYEQEVPSGTPRPVTPEGIAGGILADDGRTLLGRNIAGNYVKVVFGDAKPVPVASITTNDYPVAWTRDRTGLIISRVEVPAPVDRLDLATGARTHLADIAPPDRAGVTLVTMTQWIDDGRGYVYSYYRDLSKLYVVSGVGR